VAGGSLIVGAPTGVDLFPSTMFASKGEACSTDSLGAAGAGGDGANDDEDDDDGAQRGRAIFWSSQQGVYFAYTYRCDFVCVECWKNC
jgi:hypothetical protein